MIERERTFLAKFLPENLNTCPHKEITDLYFPAASDHAKARVRKQGNAYQIVKKTLLNPGDASTQVEQVINLDKAEYDALTTIEGKLLTKVRYYFSYQGGTAEIDIFKGSLNGLVLIDFEFEDEAAMKQFQIPDFCLAEVTQDEWIAGGILCGKSYADLEEKLNIFDYQKLFLL